MTTTDCYSEGTRIWLSHPKEGWQGAVLLIEFDGYKMLVRDDDDQVREIVVNSNNLPPLRNPEFLIGSDDLTFLSFLHEPAVLYNLKERFTRINSIYTYCGIILVSINPYEDLYIYGNDMIRAYRGRTIGELEPHIFAIAEDAYTKLERDHHDQSIIVSGESGSGKTVCAKYVMRYFATIGGSLSDLHIEKKVLASSYLMEVIGNAKTVRNDNSSRFGKYIEIHFNNQYLIQGASIRTYLLEKSRVVYHSVGERNYHIFYQLCAERGEFPHLHLGSDASFHYLNPGNRCTVTELHDTMSLRETINQLSLLGFSATEQNDMFKILASILHLGNIQMMTVDSGNHDGAYTSVISPSDHHLFDLCNILETDVDEMKKWLCLRKFETQRETFLRPLSVNDAISARDALAKHIYSELFNYIVHRINTSLSCLDESFGCIGVLDIYGFEIFEKNSFEQFCINYANEKLQQQFIQHFFKLEQEEYLKEEIQWKHVNFYDNQDCIDLMERRLGILDLLDEECKVPGGSDRTWVDKLGHYCKGWKNFSKSVFCGSAFTIHHFAGKVTYQSEGFLEKNKDAVIKEQLNVIKSSNISIIKELFCKYTAISDEENNQKTVNLKYQQPLVDKHKISVGNQFKISLNLLMKTLNRTIPHYVRCINPNDEKKPFEFNCRRVLHQLQACGILETIRMSAAGFPSKWKYEDFFQRYKLLCNNKDIEGKHLRTVCEVIVAKYITDNNQIQFGKSKIFMRAMQIAYLEKLRSEKLKYCCILIQKHVRRYIYRVRYLKVLKATRIIQIRIRKFLTQRRKEFLRRNYAAIILQKYIRCWIKRIQYLSLKTSTLVIQSYCRGYIARKHFKEFRLNHYAIVIQKCIRCWIARKQFIALRQKIILVQSLVRRYLATKKLNKMIYEARSVEYMKNLNRGLERKIFTLQIKIEKLSEENSNLRSYRNESLILGKKLGSLQSLNNEVTELLEAKEQELEVMKTAVEQERNDKLSIMYDKERAEKYYCEKIGFLYAENTMLKSNIEELKETIRLIQSQRENNNACTGNEKSACDKNDAEIQKLIERSNSLERRNVMLAREVKTLRRTGKYKRRVRRSPNYQEEVSSTTSEQTEDDIGYSSVHSAISASSVSINQRPESGDLSQITGNINSSDVRTISQPCLRSSISQEKQDRTLSRLMKKVRFGGSNTTSALSFLQFPETTDSQSKTVVIARKKNQQYVGMLSYKAEDIPQIVNRLISKLKPSIAKAFLPGLPAFIIFMCIRHTDVENDEEKMHTFLIAIINAISKVVKKYYDNFQTTVLWLSNTLTLINLLKQYSGDRNFQSKYLTKQMEQSLRNFDLSEYRHVLSDMAVWIYKCAIDSLQDRLLPLVVPAILEDEAIFGSSQKSGNKERVSAKNVTTPMDKLIQELSTLHALLNSYGVDPDVVIQIFRQLFYFFCATAMNNLLLRKDLCRWKVGMQIRYNISHLEEWCHDVKMQNSPVVEALQPITQASQLLQARKADEDVAAICSMCNKLSLYQIVKILHLYTPDEEYENRIPMGFMVKIQTKLKERQSNAEDQTLLMDQKLNFPVRFVFCPSNVKLEEIKIPDIVNLPMLKKM